MLFGYIDPGTGYTLYSLGGWFFAFIMGFFAFFLLYIKRFLAYLKKTKIFILSIFLLVIIIIASLGGFFIMKKNVVKFNKKIVVLGFDGMDPKITENMMNRGLLPNFSKLREMGDYRHLSTTNPPQSPVAWAGFATGKNPGKNGIYDFIVRDPHNYGLSLSMSDFAGGNPKRVIKSKCLWEYTSEKKIPTIILKCPDTFPPDKINGKMLSGMGVPDILGTEGTFSFYTTEQMNSKDMGGKVYKLDKSNKMLGEFVGPKINSFGIQENNAKVNFIIKTDKKTAIVEFQNKKVELKVNEWSSWQEIQFNIGILKKAKGIFRFYLVELNPEFKLYVSPINFDPRDPLFKISHPANYSKKLSENVNLFYTQGMPYDTWALNEKRIDEDAFLEKVELTIDDDERILNHEFDAFRRGLFFSYYEFTDIIQHMFWRYIEKSHQLYKDDPKYKNIIETYYMKADSILGNILEKILKEDTIIVLSDHGFSSFKRSVNINTWLKKNGFLELKNPLADEGKELFGDINWDATKAYSAGFGSIYINQKNRERNGIVSAGEETEKLKKEIIGKLLQWKDNNVFVVKNVYDNKDIFNGPYAKNAPDLCVGFHAGLRTSWQTAIGAVPKEIIENNMKKWSGDHLMDPSIVPGIIFSNKKITKKDPSIYDIAPTILSLIGFGEEKIKRDNFDGVPLF